MKRYLTALIAMALGAACFAQTTSEEFNEKYQRLVGRLGYAGVGIETYLDKWEAAFPEDGRLLEARCNYCLAKGITTQVVPKDQSKFLGAKPVISIPDSTGKKINYFEETFYDDELFGEAMTWLDKAVELYPLDLIYRADKVTCLLAYEKESPDMAVAELDKLVEMEKKSHPEWVVGSNSATSEDFSELMSGYCVRLWTVGTPQSYEAFFRLSTKLSKMFPKDSNYLDNIGSYWLVAKGKDSKAAGYYKKALKLNPSDEVAKANLKLIEKRKAAK
ncbi:MAG: hypothetical protein J6X77_05060 [Bacteroidales bacterium]|nr:hypothetical protein [Bacteroidales bacterium]